jgi:threonine aldolase
MYEKSAAQPTSVVDLRSDTVTKPTTEMRQAMANAEVGDDVYGEDPTVNRLEQRAAEIFDREAALFVPTGTNGESDGYQGSHAARPGNHLRGTVAHL